MLTVHRCKPFGQAVAKLREVERHDRPGARTNVREPGETLAKLTAEVAGGSGRECLRVVPEWARQSAYTHARVHVHVCTHPRAIASLGDSR